MPIPVSGVATHLKDPEILAVLGLRVEGVAGLARGNSDGLRRVAAEDLGDGGLGLLVVRRWLAASYR